MDKPKKNRSGQHATERRVASNWTGRRIYIAELPSNRRYALGTLETPSYLGRIVNSSFCMW